MRAQGSKKAQEAFNVACKSSISRPDPFLPNGSVSGTAIMAAGGQVCTVDIE